MRLTATVHDSVSEIPEDEWARIAREADVDYGRDYVAFRERMEAGRCVVVAAYDETGLLRAATFGSTTVPQTLLFTQVGQLLTSRQIARV